MRPLGFLFINSHIFIRRPSFSPGRNYHTSRRTRHELQAHHGHVALLNRPRSAPAMVLMCCVNVNVVCMNMNDTPRGRTEAVAACRTRRHTPGRVQTTHATTNELQLGGRGGGR